MAWLRRLNFCTSPKADSTSDEMLLWKRKKSTSEIEDEEPVVLDVPSPSPLTKQKTKLIDERIAAAKKARKTSEESISGIEGNTGATYKTSNHKIDEQIETLRREVAYLIMQNVSVIDQFMEAEATMEQLQLVYKLNQGPSRPQTFAADEFFFVRSTKYRKEAHHVLPKNTDFTQAREKCGSCHEPLANFLQHEEKNEEKKERQKSIRTRFLSNSLRSYILSDSSLNIDNELIQKNEDPLIEEREFFEKDPENDSGHEDDSVFLMENPYISVGNTEIPEIKPRTEVSSSKAEDAKEEKRKSSRPDLSRKVLFSDMVQVHESSLEENKNIAQKEECQKTDETPVECERLIFTTSTDTENKTNRNIKAENKSQIREVIIPQKNVLSEEDSKVNKHFVVTSNMGTETDSDISLVRSQSRDTVIAKPLDESDPGDAEEKDENAKNDKEPTYENRKQKKANNPLVNPQSHHTATTKLLDESHPRDIKAITSLANSPATKLLFTSSLAIRRSSSFEEKNNSGSRLRTSSLRSLESSSPKVNRPVMSENDTEREGRINFSSKYSARNQATTPDKFKTRIDQIKSDSPKPLRQPIKGMNKTNEEQSTGILDKKKPYSDANSIDNSLREQRVEKESSLMTVRKPVGRAAVKNYTTADEPYNETEYEKITASVAVKKIPPPIAKKPVNKPGLTRQNHKTDDKKFSESKMIPRPRIVSNNNRSALPRSENNTEKKAAVIESPISVRQATKERKDLENKALSFKNRTTGERTLGVRKRGAPSSAIALKTESLMRAANINRTKKAIIK